MLTTSTRFYRCRSNCWSTFITGSCNIHERNMVGSSDRGNVLQTKTNIYMTIYLVFNSCVSFPSLWIVSGCMWLKFLFIPLFLLFPFSSVVDGQKLLEQHPTSTYVFPFDPSSSALRSRSKQSGSKWTEHNRVSLVTSRPTWDIFARHSFKRESSVGKRWKLIPYWQIKNHSNIQLHNNTPLWPTEEAIDIKA